MLAKPQEKQQSSLFFSLESTLDSQHPLFILSHKIDWDMFEKEFSPLYCPDNGRPAKPIHLKVGLLMLKHIRNLSDESVVEHARERYYFESWRDVWKYGETTNPTKRYSQPQLDNMILGGVSIEPIFYGNVIEIKIQEKIMIYGYAVQHGHLPPGNKIFR